MDNQELLAQVVAVIKEQTETMTSYIDQRIGEVKIMVENDVTKRIEALFDGYKLTHEKQWEQERKIAALQSLMEDMQARLLILEQKTA